MSITSAMKISVVIPAYNAAQYIAQAIQSVLVQTRPADEIIIVDDGSTDETADVIRSFGDKVILIQQQNAGVSVARNTGINASAGNWIAFLDADDEWLPEKLQLQCEHLEHNPELSWTTGMYYYCDCEQNHKQTFKISPPQKEKIVKALRGKEYFESYFQAFALQANGHINAMIVRKDVLEKAGLFQEGQKIGEDDDLCLRLAYMKLPMGILLTPVFIYHLGVEGSATKSCNQGCHIKSLLDRHFVLSERAGMADEFKECAAGKLAFWVRKLLNDGDGRDVRILIKHYGDLLNTSYRLSTYVGAFCPSLWNAKEKIKKQIRTICRGDKNGNR